MRLLYTPSACSISAHIVLEEIGVPFETQLVNIKGGETRSEGFLKTNPKGKIPVLILGDGTVMTENPVILQFLARTYPNSRLLPTTRALEFEALQICEYLTGTIQNFGLARLLRPSAFCEDEKHWMNVRQEGEKSLLKGFELMSQRLRQGPFFFDEFSIADATLFYFELRASGMRIKMPSIIRSHYEMMLTRPAVQQVLAREELKIADFP